MEKEYTDFAFANFRNDPNLLRMLYDTNPTLVFVKDRQGRFLFANRALADVYGTTVEGLIGKTDADFNPEIGEIEHFLKDDLRVMDASAISLARENNIPILVFSIEDYGGFHRVLNEEGAYTIVN